MSRIYSLSLYYFFFFLIRVAHFSRIYKNSAMGHRKLKNESEMIVYIWRMYVCVLYLYLLMQHTELSEGVCESAHSRWWGGIARNRHLYVCAFAPNFRLINGNFGCLFFLSFCCSHHWRISINTKLWICNLCEWTYTRIFILSLSALLVVGILQFMLKCHALIKWQRF